MENYNSDTQKPDVVPVYVYDDAVVRAAHRERLHWRAHIAMLAVIVAIVILFVWYLYQYDYTGSETITVDGNTGVANYKSEVGDIFNGENNSTQNPCENTEIGSQ